MSKKDLLLSAALLVAICRGGAQASDNACRETDDPARSDKASYAPIHYTATSVTVNIQKGGSGTALASGFNAVNEPQKMTCHAEQGCLLSSITMIMPNDPGGAYVCTFVDGVPLGPPAPSPIVGYLNFLQSKRVAAGTHSVQTKVFVQSPTFLLPWEVDYTLYDQ